jgi:hypothetical protein
LTACSVTCAHCPGREWRYLCVDCAEDFTARHRGEGHDPSFSVDEPPGFDEIARRIRSLRPARRAGW